MQSGRPRPARSRATGILAGLALAVTVAVVLVWITRDEERLPVPSEAPAPILRADVLEALHRRWRSAVPTGPFHAHAGQVQVARFAPGGAGLVTGGRDHTARRWNLAGDEQARYVGHRGPVVDVAFFPAGERLLTASSDGTARLWANDGTPLAVLEGHTGGVRRVRADARGQQILTLGRDGTARLWSAAGEALGILPTTGAALAHASFVGAGAAVLVRDVEDHGVLFARTAHAFAPAWRVDGVRAVRAAADGGALLLCSDGRVVRVDPDGHQVPVPGAHAAQVLDAVLAPDGRLVTASLDGLVRIHAATGGDVIELAGQGMPVVAVDAEPGGSRVLTLAADGTARLWNADGTLRQRLAAPLLRAARFLRGRRGIAALPRGEGRLLLFDLDGKPRGALTAGDGEILELAADPGEEGLWLARDAQLSVRVLVFDEQILRAAAGLEDASLAPVLVTASATPAPQRLAPGDFVGTDGCLDCHRRAHDLWATSNHARTFEPARADNLPPAVLEGRRVDHPPGRTRFHTEGAEILAQTVGQGALVQDHPLGWVAGRRRIRMYVTRMADARLQVLPAMRAELPGEWFDYTHLLFGGGAAPPIVAPDDASFWTGATRSWGARCASCHESGAVPRAPHLHGPGPRSLARDLGVDCESCHGAGRRHAEAWARDATDAPLLSLGRLARDAQVTACTRCHMEGERLGGGDAPSDDLYEELDPTLLLDPTRVDARGRPLELIYHGLSFSVSRCAEQGGLTCTRCHGAHGGPYPALLGRPPTNDELCGSCHVELVRDVAAHSHHAPTATGALCTSCHMPRLVIERGHGIITDHSFGIPDPDTAGTDAARDACSWCHGGALGAPEGVPPLDAAALQARYRAWWPEARRAQPWMEAVEAVRRGEVGVGPRLAALAGDRALPRTVRASLTRLLGRVPQEGADALLAAVRDEDSLVRRSAVYALGNLQGPDADAALRAALADPSRPVRIAAARTALEGWTRVQANPALLAAILPVLADDAEAMPNDEMRWFLLGAARDVAGDVAGALEAYDRMLALHPLSANVRARVQTLRKGR